MMQKTETFDRQKPPDQGNRTLNLDALRSFVAICETGSFRRAAARTNKSPSAVSLQIAKLEALLDVRLLDRDARHVALTGHGERLLGRARRLLSLNDETLARFQAAPLAGRLSLAAPHDLGISLVPGLLRRLAERHPDVHVDVRLGTAQSVQTGLTGGRVNLALFNDVGPSDIPARDLFSEPLKWLILKGGRAAQNDPLPLAVADMGCAWRDAALSALHSAGRAYRIAYSSDTSMGQVAAVRADLAVAALPASLADRNLVEAPAHDALPALPLTHIRMANDGGDLAKAFSDLVAADMQARARLSQA